MDFAGTRVVVVGGTSGIGLATARETARRGASVVVASSRKERVDAALGILPEGVEGHVVDAADEASVKSFFEAVGEFHHLVFTAGGGLLLGELDELGLAEAREAFGVRFWGAWMAAKYAKGNIAPGGSIVLSSGIAGARPQPGGTVVAAVCGAIEALTRALAVELAPIRVNAVAAGMVHTELWDDVDPPVREAIFARASRRLPARRTGEASDIAESHLYLMSDRFVTGTVLTVDGGALLT